MILGSQKTFLKFPFPFENNLLFADNAQAIKGLFFLFVCFVKHRLLGFCHS